MNKEVDPDVELMLAVQRGDVSAFERLFEKHIRAVVGFAARFVGTRARAEELAQDVFLQVFRNRSRYEPRARFATWLYRMVTNACLSEVRRVDHRRSVPQADDYEERAVVTATDRTSEDDAADREMLQRMQAALGDLPPQQRAALLLARVEGLSYDEVADALSCSVSAVKSLVHRATVTLRDRVKESGET